MNLGSGLFLMRASKVTILVVLIMIFMFHILNIFIVGQEVLTQGTYSGKIYEVNVNQQTVVSNYEGAKIPPYTYDYEELNQKEKEFIDKMIKTSKNEESKTLTQKPSKKFIDKTVTVCRHCRIIQSDSDQFYRGFSRLTGYYYITITEYEGTTSVNVDPMRILVAIIKALIFGYSSYYLGNSVYKEYFPTDDNDDNDDPGLLMEYGRRF